MIHKIHVYGIKHLIVNGKFTGLVNKKSGLDKKTQNMMDSPINQPSQRTDLILSLIKPG